MQTVYKYPLEVTSAQTLSLPRDAKILAVQFQKLSLELWAIVDPLEDVFEARRIEIWGTGHKTDEIKGKYLGTVQQYGGQLIWHVFDCTD